MDTKKYVSLPGKFSIGFGIFGQALLTGLITSYISYFGTDILLVSSVALGNIMLFSKLFDGVTDIGMGFLIDKTNSKAGKARPWIFRSIIPFALFSVLLFAVPLDMSDGVKLAWVFIFYNLHALAYTALAIAMNTLNIRLSRNPKEINTLSTVLIFGTILGNVVINAAAVGALTALSGTPEPYTQGGYLKFAAILAVVCAIGGLSTYFLTRELSDSEIQQGSGEKTPALEGLKSLVKNKYWLMQVANNFFIYLGLNARLATMIYFGIYVLGNPELIAFLVIADNVPSLLCMPIALGLCNKFGKRKVSLIGLCGTMIGFAIMFLNVHNFPLLIVGLIIRGICFAPIQGAGNAFIVDSATYGEWKTGVKAEGMAFSAVSFAQKVSAGIASSLVLWGLAIVGYIPNAFEQPASAISGIIFMYIGVTFICTIGQIIVFALYDLDGKIDSVRAELAERNGTNG